MASLEINDRYRRPPSDERIRAVADALRNNGIACLIVETGVEAKQKILELIPGGAEVMNMTSVTLDAIGVAEEIVGSGRYRSVRRQFETMDPQTQGSEMKKLGAGPEWAVGSVHAVTEDGSVMIASATGSQLPAYAYGSTQVIWAVGWQKLVKSLDEGMKRIYEYSFPLEDERARKVYGIGSSVNKVLIVNKEVVPERITLIIIKETLGF
jgi:hypothetical protein